MKERGSYFSKNKKTIYIFISLMIILVAFVAFNNIGDDYVLITGNTATTPCTNLGGDGCTQFVDDGETLINDNYFCSGYSSGFYSYCVACSEGYEWVKDSNDVIKGSCNKILEL